jgi:hypothetical protein
MSSSISTTAAKISLEEVGAFTRYGTLIVGGLCLLMYSYEIGQFPEVRIPALGAHQVHYQVDSHSST